MAETEEQLQNLHLSESNQQSPSSSYDPLLHLLRSLASCSSLIEAGEFEQSQQAVSELVDFLSSISDSILNRDESEDSENTAFEIVEEIRRFIFSSSLHQEVIDALSFELPKVVCRFACASERCLETAESIIYCFIEKCSPRDMLTILCEALGCASENLRLPGYFIPILGGITKVLVLIQRRRFEQLKAAFPIILNVLKSVSLESEDDDQDLVNLFFKAIGIANSIQSVLEILEGDDKQKLRALFGLFVLQIMALVSMAIRSRVQSCLPLVLQLSRFLPCCGLSYLGLITGSDVDMIMKIVLQDDGDDYISCFCHVKHGASLAVIWGCKSHDVALAAEADLLAVRRELLSNYVRRWQGIDMLKYIFSSVNLSWELKHHAVNFLLSVMEGDASHLPDEHVDHSTYAPSLFSSLQAIQMVVIYAPNGDLRKNAFHAFKKVLEDIPSSLRFDILKALIKNSDSSSMVAILFNCVKDEMHKESGRKFSRDGGSHIETSVCTFWNPSVLDLVEFVLRPPQGGPPPLPEYGDAVLSALNLFRFILITESTGGTNKTEVLSKDNLQKAYNEWLLPLRTLLTGIMAENQKDYDEVASDILCSLNPVEFVLYRCIELTEENLENLA